MKRIILSAVLFLNCSICYAQLPGGAQPNTGLPVPRPRPLAPPDLQVTAISFVSIIREAASSLVRVSVTIRNNGGLQAAASKLKGYEAWARDGNPRSWKLIEGMPAVAAIAPGKSHTAEYVFRVSNLTADKTFAIKVQADGAAAIAESNEANNTSSPVIINPR